MSIDLPKDDCTVGQRFDKLDGMNFSGVVRARFVDGDGRRCYLVHLDKRTETALVIRTESGQCQIK